MIDIIKSIILDFQEFNFYTGTPRHLTIKTLPGKAAICIGVRRCGKSTYLFQVIKQLLDQGVQRENILYLNFFDDRLHALNQKEPGLIAEAYYSLYPEKKNNETVYCFFDEIQTLKGWEPFVDRMMRTEQCEIYLTGSSAKMLSREIATQMRGRALSWELFPFSFPEFLDHQGINRAGPLTTRKRLFIQKAFDTFRETGGFPEVAEVDRHLRVKIHQEYFQSVLFRDVIERHDTAHPRAVKDLAHRLIDNTAALYSINRLTGYLKSLGHKVPKSTVSDYLNWFEDAYFLFTVQIYDASAARRRANPKKIYCVDHALVSSVAAGILINAGHLLENMVFIALRRISTHIYYYKTKNGLEVDFITESVRHVSKRKQCLVQVCESMADPITRKREIAGLTEAMTELGMSSAMIVTSNEEGEIETDNGTITILPIWRFLLNMPHKTAD